MGSSISKETPQAIKCSKSAGILRKRIISRSSSVDNDFAPPFHEKTNQSIEFIKESLTGKFLYNCLGEEEKKEFIDAMYKDIIDQGVDIIKQGDIGTHFYVVEEGKVQFFVDGEKTNTCSRGGSFGELALMFGYPCAATCRSITSVTAWKIDDHTFRHIMAYKARKSIRRRKDLMRDLKRVSILSKLEDTHLKKVADALKIEYYTSGTNIIKKGEIGKYFYIINDGTVKIHDIGVGGSNFVNTTIEKGCHFGEMALINEQPRLANVTAVTDCSVLRLSKDKFHTTVGNYEDMIKSAFRKEILLSAPVFANLELKKNEIHDLISLFEEKEFEKETFFIKAGDLIRDPGFHIIEEGKVRILEENTGIIADLIKGDHFGGHTIKSTREETSQRSIKFLEPTKLATLSRSSVESVLSSTSHLGRSNSYVRKLSQITIDELNQCRILGDGYSSTVRLAYHMTTMKPYALKIIPKRKTISQEKFDQIIRTKNLLASLTNAPFIVQLITTFQDKQNLYFLFDFIQGGELFNIIHSNNTTGISIKEALFYSACMVIGLNCLEKCYICHRDIKPENVLIDKEGYCVLVDFDEATVTTDETFTFCGTPEYLAPEMILHKGHNQGVDYWAIGIILFELLTSNTPFYENEIDNVALFKRIVKVKYNFPNNGKFTDNIRDFIGKLLVKNPSQRLGCLADGIRGMKKHPVFEEIDWTKMLRKEIKPPRIPKIKGEMDPSNFDVYPEPQVHEPVESITEKEQALFKDF